MIPHTFERTLGREPVPSWQPHIASPFVVFKDPASNSWTAGHILSGKVITKIVPRRYMAARADVVEWLARMEAALPDVVMEYHAYEPPEWALYAIREWSVNDDRG